MFEHARHGSDGTKDIDLMGVSKHKRTQSSSSNSGFNPGASHRASSPLVDSPMMLRKVVKKKSQILLKLASRTNMVETMRSRAINNKSYVYVKVPQVLVCVS